MLKFTAKDITGVCQMHPTPTVANGGDWRATDSVDYDTTRKLSEACLATGVKGFALCGTTGECAALLWDEKFKYIQTVVETVKKRAYIFAGCTSLGTKETIRQMREMQKIGADGAFVGMPLWQTPTMENAVQFHADLAEALPDFPVMVYANANFFKSYFPNEFWVGIGQKAHTTVTTKISYIPVDLAADVKAATPRMKFLQSSGRIIESWRALPDYFNCCWSIQMAEPYVALMEAINRKDTKTAEQIQADLRTLPSRNRPPPPGAPAPTGQRFGPDTHGAKYNVQTEKTAFNASSEIKVGPLRPPYRDLPEEDRKPIEIWGKAYMELRKRYAKQPVK